MIQKKNLQFGQNCRRRRQIAKIRKKLQKFCRFIAKGENVGFPQGKATFLKLEKYENGSNEQKELTLVFSFKL